MGSPAAVCKAECAHLQSPHWTADGQVTQSSLVSLDKLVSALTQKGKSKKDISCQSLTPRGTNTHRYTHKDVHTETLYTRKKTGLRDQKSHMVVLKKNKVRIGIEYIPLLSLTVACQDSRIPDTGNERTKRDTKKTLQIKTGV